MSAAEKFPEPVKAWAIQGPGKRSKWILSWTIRPTRTAAIASFVQDGDSWKRYHRRGYRAVRLSAAVLPIVPGKVKQPAATYRTLDTFLQIDEAVVPAPGFRGSEGPGADSHPGGRDPACQGKGWNREEGQPLDIDVGQGNIRVIS